MSKSTLTMVVGYVVDVDHLPSEPARLGLVRRVAFVLDSYRSDKVDMYFDARLYAALVESVREVLRADRLSAALSPGAEVELGVGELIRWLEQLPELEREPLPLITVEREGIPVALIMSEPWARAGGPEPYHDSYTVPVFTREDVAAPLQTAARAICQRLGAELTDVIHASEVASPPGVLKRVKSLFGL
jgi:hypothetical protein